MRRNNDSEARKFFRQAKRMKDRAEANIKKRNLIFIFALLKNIYLSLTKI